MAIGRKAIKKLTKKQTAYLRTIYGTPKQAASFTGPLGLYNEVKRRGKYKLHINQIKQFLSHQESYVVSKPRPEKFQKPYYVTYFKYQLLQTDLMYMRPYKDENDSVTYILTCLDTFSRTLWVRALRDKKGETVTSSFREILEEISHSIVNCTSDMGSEYKCHQWKNLMKEYKINHFFSTTGKAHGVERVQRTLRSKLMKYMIKKSTKRYIDQLQNIVYSYNRTLSRVTGVRPIDVNQSNQYEIFQRINKTRKIFKRKPFKFARGNRVLISFSRNLFSREFSERWSRISYEIAHRYRNQNINMYKLYSEDGHLMFGSFYEAEIQLVTVSDDKLLK